MVKKRASLCLASVCFFFGFLTLQKSRLSCPKKLLAGRLGLDPLFSGVSPFPPSLPGLPPAQCWTKTCVGLVSSWWWNLATISLDDSLTFLNIFVHTRPKSRSLPPRKSIIKFRSLLGRLLRGKGTMNLLSLTMELRRSVRFHRKYQQQNWYFSSRTGTSSQTRRGRTAQCIQCSRVWHGVFDF